MRALAESTAFDTNVIVAALASWHEDHVPALDALRAANAEPSTLVLPAPALVEAFAALTLLPAPHRLAPTNAAAVLADNVRDRARVVSHEPRQCWELLDSLGSSGTAGGLTHDAHVLACAHKGGARRLLVFNGRDVAGLATGDVAIVDPRDE
jgi:predicted nucleic acid-binding protein